MASIRHKRGTRTQLNTAKASSLLNVGEIYLITDESRLVVATAVNNYVDLPKLSELDTKSDVSHNHSGVYEPAFTKNTAFNKNFGTAVSTVCQGNDSRLSNARTPTSHNNTYHSETYITASGVTYENLNTNGDVGTGSNQVAAGNHTHSSIGINDKWLSAITFSRDNNTTIKCSTSYISNSQSYGLVGKLIKWLDSSDVLKIAWITGRYIGSGYCYLYLNGDPVETTDDLTSFQISINEKVQVMDWFIPGEQVADSSNSAGKEYVTPYNIRVISCSGYVGTAASGTGAALTYDIYDDGTGIFSTDPSFGTNASVTNSVPASDIVIASGSRISLRTPTAAGATTKPQNLNVLMYYCTNELLSAI